MSLTLEQRTNHDGVPKAAELIEISGAGFNAAKPSAIWPSDREAVQFGHHDRAFGFHDAGDDE